MKYILFSILILPALATGNEKRLFYLDESTGTLNEYVFSTKKTSVIVKVPTWAFRQPFEFDINHQGQAIFRTGEGKYWYWDGKQETTFSRKIASDWWYHQPILAANEGAIFWYTNHDAKAKAGKSSKATFRIFRTDLATQKDQEIVKHAFPECACTTGVCSESCPEAQIIFPHSQIDKSFFVNHRISGQTEARLLATYEYRNTNGKWKGTKIKKANGILDATLSGDLQVERVLDEGCCGWTNQSNDQTVLRMKAGSTVFFDERKKYSNKDFDIGFFSANAFIAGDDKKLAHTVKYESNPGGSPQENELAKGVDPQEQSIRFVNSIGSKDDLITIFQGRKELPAIDVVDTQNPQTVLAHIPNATAMGWVDDHHLLIWQNGGKLSLYDLESKTATLLAPTPQKDDFVFLR